MPTLENYKGQTPAWCPGCGNFAILKTFKDAMVELGIEPVSVYHGVRNRSGRKIPSLHTMQYLQTVFMEGRCLLRQNKTCKPRKCLSL